MAVVTIPANPTAAQLDELAGHAREAFYLVRRGDLEAAEAVVAAYGDTLEVTDGRPAPPASPDPTPDPEPVPPAAVERPGKRAGVDAWRAYAAQLDPTADLDELTKADLVELVELLEADADLDS